MCLARWLGSQGGVAVVNSDDHVLKGGLHVAAWLAEFRPAGVTVVVCWLSAAVAGCVLVAPSVPGAPMCKDTRLPVGGLLVASVALA